MRTLRNITTNTTGHAALSIMADWIAPLKTGLSVQNRWEIAAAADILAWDRVADARMGALDDISALIGEGG